MNTPGPRAKFEAKEAGCWQGERNEPCLRTAAGSVLRGECAVLHPQGQVLEEAFLHGRPSALRAHAAAEYHFVTVPTSTSGALARFPSCCTSSFSLNADQDVCRGRVFVARPDTTRCVFPSVWGLTLAIC